MEKNIYTCNFSTAAFDGDTPVTFEIDFDMSNLSQEERDEWMMKSIVIWKQGCQRRLALKKDGAVPMEAQPLRETVIVPKCGTRNIKMKLSEAECYKKLESILGPAFELLVTPGKAQEVYYAMQREMKKKVA